MVDHPNNSSLQEGGRVMDDQSKTKNSVEKKKKNGITGKVKAGMSLLFERAPAEKYMPSSPVGVTEELLTFVTDLVKRPKTWVRFPLPEEAKANEFALNNAQQLHVGAVEREVPKLTRLRFDLCPDRMSEGRFWMVYFVMLHPKLDKNDALALSSHQIVRARKLLAAESKQCGKDKQTEGSLVSSDGASTSDSTPERASESLKSQKHQSEENSAAAKSSKHLKTDQMENQSNAYPNEKNPYINFGKDVPVSSDDRISFSEWKIDDTEATKCIA